uniref:Large ribosomal subunit protein bL9 n=1 Tax=Candidatus Kentrum eta TaxID=2126337 RepID=A0A450VK55_9GAMM|nr:MAG: large subunit ribosomal protein L9 [Candidatus Kentron sp. H]VFK05131.1 MAG: large subunit ribosomal protein L9 [Candidatus Kentron sp. H]VFK08609.1 MAG: large subunit ribosomal protein L9 [Candidatus Kentron sp. H]
MEVILLEKTENLGQLGDIVKVKPGYARNYLVPKRKAVFATPDNVALFEARRAELEKQGAEALAQAQARAEKIDGFTVTIPVRAGDEGRLFGSIGTRDIAAAAAASGIDIVREEIRLSTGLIRQVGEQEVTVHLHTGVEAVITVNTVPE